MSKVAIVGDASGTGTFTISAPNGNTDRTLVLPDEAGTVLTSASPVVYPKGVPAFRAYLSADQTVTVNVNTKINFNTEVFDTASCFNNTGSAVGGIPAYAFMPNVAGYYQVNLNLYGNSTSSLSFNYIQIWKNGAENTSVVYGPWVGGTSILGNVSTLVYLNGTTDYIEAYGQESGAGTIVFKGGSAFTVFSGVLVRAD